MIIDAHAHVFPPGLIYRRDDLMHDPCFAELYGDRRARMVTADELVSSMDQAGIDKAAVSAIGWSSHQLCYEHNDYLMEAVSHWGNRLIGFGMVQPLRQTECLKEIERINAGGLKGIGEFRPDMQGIDLECPAVVQPFADALFSCNMVLQIHASEPTGRNYPGKGRLTPEVLYRFIQKHSRLTIILAHWGGGLPFYELQPEVRSNLENVYYDTAATPFLYDSSIYSCCAGLAGAGKILFGSDFPLLSYERCLKHLQAGALSEDVVRHILGLNASRVLKLDQEGK